MGVFFSFSYGLTTRINFTFNDNTIDFHRFRSRLISETLITLLGEEAPETTVLDLACHCGVFSMDVANRGIKHVHGIDYRKKNLDQANFLKNYYRIKNVSFEQGDVYKLDTEKKYDVIMCLGILYHIVQPIDLLEFCYKNANKFAIIETLCHKQPISAYMIIGDKNVEVAIEGTKKIELHPTYRGIIDTMRQVGFKTIFEVVGNCETQIELFSDNTRRCFVAFKE